MTAGVEDPRFNAAVDFIGRTGAKTFRLGFSDEEDPPIVWHALGAWEREGELVYECEGAMDPLSAVLRLCERVGDGGMCTHCGRPLGFEPSELGEMPADQLICWTQFDPELKKYRRGCEGS